MTNIHAVKRNGIQKFLNFALEINTCYQYASYASKILIDNSLRLHGYASFVLLKHDDKPALR